MKTDTNTESTRSNTPQSTVDLHAHSTASDGTLSPAALVDLASRRGIRVLGLTDHDTTEGLAEALAEGARVGVSVVPGVELGTSVAAGELHMLGYFIDRHDESLQQTLREFREGRERRVERIVERLREFGIPLDLASVRRLARGGAIGRAHIARSLVQAGFAVSVDDAFERYLVRGRPAYVARPRLEPVDAVGLIRGAGGAAVLAHPFSVADLDTTLPALVDAGLAGLEVHYGAYSPEQRTRLARLAEHYNLVPTGGSDFHGIGEHEGAELGDAPVPVETVALLRDRTPGASRTEGGADAAGGQMCSR